MYKKIIISILVVLVSLFVFLAIYTKGFHINYQNYNDYITIESVYYDGERIPAIIGIDGEYNIVEYDGEIELYGYFYIYYKSPTIPYYRLVNDEKIPVYHFDGRSYIQIKDIKNVRVW